MTDNKPKSVGASVRQRLLNISRENRTDFVVTLSDYAHERLLYRLSCSQHRDRFVLKVAMLFRIWSDEPHRTTRDMDLMAYGNPAAEDIARLFREVCELPVENDGVVFQGESLRVEEIREAQEYDGVRVRITATIAGARVRLQIDVGFGDAVVPPAEEMTYPALLDFPAPRIKTYARETMIAEKFQAMVSLGIANSRMKDFYDIYVLATKCEFNGPMVQSAIKATFERRYTPVPPGIPTALTAEFSEDRTKLAQWRAFVSSGKVRQSALTLADAVQVLKSFLLAPTGAVSQGRSFDARWVPPGPWTE